MTATHVAWKEVKGSPFVPSPLLYGDELYLVNDMASIVTAYDARSGTVLWQGRLGQAAREGFSASPVGVDGKPKDIEPNCSESAFNDGIAAAVSKMVYQPGLKGGQPTDWPGMSIPMTLTKPNG